MENPEEEPDEGRFAVPERIPTAALIFAALLVPCLLFAAPASAQKREAATGDAAAEGEMAAGFKDLVEVSEVLLDVVATDAEGAPVVGLGEEDFVVEEGGEPVKITGVSYYSTRYGPGETPDTAEEIPWSRYLIFFFDHQPRDARYGSESMRQKLRSLQQCRRWVEEEMQPSDWAAVVRWDGDLAVYRDFTQDRDSLLSALERAATGKRPADFEPGRRRAGEEFFSIRDRLEPRENRGERETIYGALGRVAAATGHVVGRKNLLLFTLGFGERDPGGYESYPDPERYPELEALLNDHNVAVYPVDLTPPGRQARYGEVLERIATDTGGFYDEDFVGVLRLIKDVAEENQGFYLLSYQSPRPAGEIGYQRLEVRARDPEISVRARRGYRYGL